MLLLTVQTKKYFIKKCNQYSQRPFEEQEVVAQACALKTILCQSVNAKAIPQICFIVCSRNTETTKFTIAFFTFVANGPSEKKNYKSTIFIRY